MNRWSEGRWFWLRCLAGRADLQRVPTAILPQYAQPWVQLLTQPLTVWPYRRGRVRVALGRIPLAISLAIAILLGFPTPAPASPLLASLHTYPEPSGGSLYRSLQSLRDDQDRAWQAILFKRVVQGQTETVQLRLVGFPGQVHVAHPAPLVIRGAAGLEWSLPDQTDQDPQLQTAVQTSDVPLENVAQYDARPLLAHLGRAMPLEVWVSLTSDAPEVQGRCLLTVPPFVVREWLSLAELGLSLERGNV